ncbi:rhodanese-like domain-containing protein [Rhodococcus sp. GXMU-t2271]|uniref:Rhodanese-like domain-containing protein n=1 Tax=Rhodococcus indonesiensis TaxID=3055869 RepID=A0ABT7RSL2_9NOCA|nr:rhodanese-like domain-containing protein [Rhodococcus indonesiensis]MDM7490628.1 rhodanese-like domain-containing protein [Rhodococcus indonesiensis]
MSYAGDMTPQQAWELLRDNPDAVLVDVRTDAEWKYVGVPETSPIGRRTVFVEWVRYPNGARNENFVDQLKDAGVTGGPIVFLCRSGHRSIAAAEAATAAGLAPSYNILEGFEGGLDAERHRGAEGWRAAGLPWRQS